MMKRKRWITGTVACMVALSSLAVRAMAAQEEEMTMQVLDVKEENQLLVQVTEVDGTTITAEIGTLEQMEEPEERPEPPEGTAEERPEPPEGTAEERPELPEETDEERPQHRMKKAVEDLPFTSSGETITFSIQEDWPLSVAAEASDAEEEGITEGMLLLIEQNEEGEVVFAKPWQGGHPPKMVQPTQMEEITEEN